MGLRLWAARRTTRQEAFPTPLGRAHAPDSRDTLLEKHFQQAELSGNILLLKESPKLLIIYSLKHSLLMRPLMAFLFSKYPPSPSMGGSGW